MIDVIAPFFIGMVFMNLLKSTTYPKVIKYTMATGVLAWVLLMGLLNGCTNSSVEDKTHCNLESSYNMLATDLRRLADLKEVCGHLAVPKDFPGCISSPNLPGINFYTRTCKDIDEELLRVEDWLSAMEQPIMERCRTEPICLGWASATNGVGGAPILK